MHNAYTYYRAALKIQTKFRAIKAKQDTMVRKGEFLAATLIQSAWRGFVCYTDYIFTMVGTSSTSVTPSAAIVAIALAGSKAGMKLWLPPATVIAFFRHVSPLFLSQTGLY